ncbi:filamentous hemagglutinin N-terminal domain-containing protein [Haemophilus influenzae biotype aegyptius]|uniref:two-partner secretion domain-containing protein n=5 Tax=Haemophilus influenzae TaxID=727 RepID=UPI0003193F9D|nr:filamentous hemagglutinin N-terminal domain-containing protein [Haemophilus influenzae]QEQ62678.1 filamentous hemagglutinin N-terminal domain-containing protein [Haemophilus influenzae biotype aegyptius]QEQ63606.1 filamentous hemagglutinin N-terminal domain-containing protein [Haemophilus influenzae biotype aegyptius]QEQ66243.1 filamentous hemagglutinin N-terminal domain-containing protein [Haemophilus influenzae biotype aegyptius]
MNKIYRLKFSKRLNQLVAVSEITAGHDRHSGCQNAVDTTSSFQMTKWLKLKPLASLISLLSFGFATQTAMANGLQGMEVVSGSASMSINGKSTTITNSPNAIINWKQFNINQDELVRFVQENSNSAVFNRVTSDQISQLKGALNSNGQVFLINPNGIVMGKDAVINAAAFTASTLNILDEDLKARNFNFEQAKDKAMAQIVNNGLISVSKNGSVNLIGGSVKNNGVIKVEDGNILLLAGQKVTISDMTNPTITYSVVAPENKAVNLGTIFAKNGKIQVHAGSLVNKGTLNANSVRQDKSGEIILSAKEGEANIDGTVTLNNANFKAGSLTITGKKVVLNSGAKVELTGKEGGTVYIGGDERGKGEIQLAKTTKIKQGASVNVSGFEKGGRAIVWGDFAQVDGEIIANGKNKENGGFVETSGHYLGVSNTAKVEAKDWLLDPYNVRIVAQNNPSSESEKSIDTSPPFKVKGNDAVIFNTTITAALNNGTDVTITTNKDKNEGSQMGNLSVEANIIKTSSKEATLTLIANNTFTQKANTKITSNDGKLNVTIEAGNGLELKGEIDTKGGHLNINTTSGNTLIENAFLKGKGNITITGSPHKLYDRYNNNNNNNNNKTYNKLTVKNTEFKGYDGEGLKLQYNSLHRDWYDGRYEFFSSWEGNITTEGKVVFERKVTDSRSDRVVMSTHDWSANLTVKSGSFEFLDIESKLGYDAAYNNYKDYKLLNIKEDVIFETKEEGSSATFKLKPYLGNGSDNVRGLSVTANITAKGTGRVTFDANANGYAVAGIYFDKRSGNKSTTIKTEGTTTLEFKGKSASREGLAIKNPLVLDAQEGSHIILNGSSGRAAVNVSASADVTIKGDGETSIKSTSGNVEVNANIKSDSSTVNITSEKNINIKENVEVKGKSVNLEAAEHLTLGNQAKVTATMGDAILSGKNITNSGTVNAKVGNVNVNAKENFTNESTGKLDAKGKVTVDAETVDNKGVIDGHKATSVTAGQKVTNHESGQILSTEGDVYVITNGILHNNGYIQGKTGTTIVEGQRQSKDNLMSDLIHTLGDIQRTVRSSLRAAENEQHPSSSAKSLMFYDKGRAVNKVASIISHGSVCSVELPAGKNIADGRLLTSCLAENEKSKAEYHKQSEKVGD